MITFVACYIDLPPIVISKLPQVEAESLSVADPRRLISAMFASAERFHPGCGKVVLTDLATPLNFPPEIKVIRSPLLNPMRLEYSRLKAYSEYLEHIVMPTHVVFLHYDMLIQTDLLPIFDKKFDLALTCRPMELKIFKSELFLIPSKRCKAASRLYKQLAETLATNHPKFMMWGGIEIALLTFINPMEFMKNRGKPMTVNGFDFLFLKGEQYNYIPVDSSDVSATLKEKQILHFQGARKALFWNYCENFL